MSIYWPDNSTFYVGEVIGFDNVTGRHHVLYDSGDQEHLALDAAKVLHLNLLPGSQAYLLQTRACTGTVDKGTWTDST